MVYSRKLRSKLLTPHMRPQLLRVSQRTRANEQTIELLAPRVKALAESLCAPVSQGDAKEQERRKDLEQ